MITNKVNINNKSYIDVLNDIYRGKKIRIKDLDHNIDGIYIVRDVFLYRGEVTFQTEVITDLEKPKGSIECFEMFPYDKIKILKN